MKICYKKILITIGCLVLMSCGGSNEDSSGSVIGTWRGVVEYDTSSCGDVVTDFVPDISGTEYVLTVFEPSEKSYSCELQLVDQNGRMYILNASREEENCELDPYVFASVEREDGLGFPTEPTGINFRNVSLNEADISFAFFLNRFAVCRFVGVFQRG